MTETAAPYFNFSNIMSVLEDKGFIVVNVESNVREIDFAVAITERVLEREDFRLAYFSLCGSKEDLVQRILASGSKVARKKLDSGELLPSDWGKLASAATHLSNSKLFIDDSNITYFSELRSKAEQMKMNEGIQLVIIDNIQLIGAVNCSKDRSQGVEDILSSLKILAKELDVQIIALNKELDLLEGKEMELL